MNTVETVTTQAQVRGIVKDNTGEPVPGANVFWVNTGQGVTTKEDGSFSITKPSKSNMLVISFIGFQNDTIHVSKKNQELDITLREGVELNEVNVVSRRMGTMKLRSSVMNEEMISSAELSRAACCNLGESFVTNPSVDVSYSDAATGAKQIKLLGLSGTYVQMLTENIPNYRGAASPYGLGLSVCMMRSGEAVLAVRFTRRAVPTAVSTCRRVLQRRSLTIFRQELR